jgi:hypothetical protein
MNNLLLKIRSLKPDKLLMYLVEGEEPVTLILEGKTPQAVRSTLEAENPFKVRLIKGDENLLTWSQDTEEIAPAAQAPAGAPDFDLFLRLMMKAQETISKHYESMMQQSNKQIEIILGTQGKLINRLDSKIEKLEERLEDSLDVHMDAALSAGAPGAPGEPAESSPATPNLAGMDINQIVEIVTSLLREKKTE